MTSRTLHYILINWRIPSMSHPLPRTIPYLPRSTQIDSKHTRLYSHPDYVPYSQLYTHSVHSISLVNISIYTVLLTKSTHPKATAFTVLTHQRSHPCSRKTLADLRSRPAVAVRYRYNSCNEQPPICLPTTPIVRPKTPSCLLAKHVWRVKLRGKSPRLCLSR